ncbi:Dam family site-specific DNA-(adenine-N6)-methyltransferase [Microbacterium sp. P26]|uniref:DNA adenine methylase n=1 Tax=Microbacterium TaxID=33882 RepID=UPI00203DEB14|nr:Dam family site-specific DNA-(adenine-N6)-methyltransferase [Microbacterium sp. P26]MCM3500902.1 Dam family site-specific DNA-(adenine-N6)-methyltransferase [Microbacterium sp. P26]
MAKSPLRWVGSKRSLLPDIVSRFPTSFNRYIEPFVGSGCVFFEVEPSSAILSDFNPELIQFYVELRDSPAQMISELKKFDVEGGDYLDVRSLKKESLDAPSRAARFLYLNRFSFNGLYRTNRQGEFNVPRGSRVGAFPTPQQLYDCSLALQGTQIFNCDYLECLRSVAEGDLVYLDPPYRNDGRATHGEYGYGSFGSSDDVARLARELRRLSGIGAQVLLSFNEEPELEAELTRWQVTNVSRRRSVSGSVAGRTVLLGEILADNFSSQYA